MTAPASGNSLSKPVRARGGRLAVGGVELSGVVVGEPGVSDVVVGDRGVPVVG
jgi:hypothetical protein